MQKWKTSLNSFLFSSKKEYSLFQPSTLYADINGHVVPCAQSVSSPGKYYVKIFTNIKQKNLWFLQVSVAAATHKQLAKGRTTVRLYDDESYSFLRKVRRMTQKDLE